MDILKFEEQSSVFYNRSRTDRGYVNQFKVGFAKHSSFAVTDMEWKMQQSFLARSTIKIAR